MYVDEDERDDLIATFEAHVQDLMISQEDLLHQVRVLEAKNEMYYKTNLKLLPIFWYWKIC